MISASDFATIRTHIELDTPVWFYFEGELFLDDQIEIKPKAKFKGFNCAVRKENNYITSYERVIFNKESLIDPIENNDVNFILQDVNNHLTAIHGRTTFSVAIPVNRISENYRAIEHFTFSFDNNNLNDVNLAWTRYSPPRIQDEVELGYRWVYCGYGVKLYTETDEIKEVLDCSAF